MSEKGRDRGKVTLAVSPCLCQRRNGERESYVDDFSLLVSEKEKERGRVTLMTCPPLCQRRKRTEGKLR